jgi:putative acetyltransferase
MYIRETGDADLNEILLVEGAAFDSGKEVELTAARLVNSPREVAVSFLAPLAVVPKFQRRGVGGSLIKNGLERLVRSGMDLVFVVGHPGYYPRYGFTQAGKLGFESPFPMSVEHADAWMVYALRPDLLGSVTGKVVCCDTLNKPELWQQ